MTKAAEDVLTAFDALSPADQQRVTAEILRRVAPSEDLSEGALDELADELFNTYEVEENAR